MNELDPTNLVLLQTFYEVARTGSVTHAARNLGRSQPAVSHRLRALEADLGVRLFEKVGRHLQLTDFGRRLQVECLDLMARSQHIRERVTQTQKEVEGRVTIGTLPTVASHLLVPSLRALFERYPKVAIIFRFDEVPRLFQRLRTGELDVLVVVGAHDEKGVDIQPVGEASLVAVMAPAMAPARRKTISPLQLRRSRYLAYGGERDPTFQVIDRYAKANDLEGPYTPHVPHIETLRELAAAKAGYALLPAYTVRQDQRAGRLVALRARGLDTKVGVSVVGRKDQVMTPASEVVRTALHGLRAQLRA